jgi:hypothetical protein
MPRILGLGVDLLRVAALGIASVTPPVISNYILAENNDRFLTEDGINLLIQE